ncbi:VOC family protein [Aeromonas jandaei]
MGIIGVHHTALIVSDYGKAKRFYIDIMGFEQISEIYRADKESYKLDLKASDGSLIEIFTFPNPPARLIEPEACGLRHLALKTSNLKETLQCMKDQGVICHPIRFDDLTGKHFAFIDDPDGLPIELYEQCADLG